MLLRTFAPFEPGNPVRWIIFRSGQARGVPKAGKRCLYAVFTSLRGAWKRNREYSMIRKLTFVAALLAATVLSRRGERKDLRLLLGRLAGRLRPGPVHRRHDLRRVVAHRFTTAWSSSSTARPKSSRASPRAGTISDDGLDYTFKLRPGVKFQTTDFFTPTRDFNADDVIFSFERQLEDRQSLASSMSPAPPGNIPPAWACRS